MDLKILVSHGSEYLANHPHISDEELRAELQRFVDEYSWGPFARDFASRENILLWPIMAIWESFAGEKRQGLIQEAMAMCRTRGEPK